MAGKLVSVAARLHGGDVKELKRRSKKTGAKWTAVMREQVHASLQAPARIFKFIIPQNEWRVFKTETGERQYAGMLALVLADSHEEALEMVKRYANENGLRGEWVTLADVVELPVVKGVFGWAQV